MSLCGIDRHVHEPHKLAGSGLAPAFGNLVSKTQLPVRQEHDTPFRSRSYFGIAGRASLALPVHERIGDLPGLPGVQLADFVQDQDGAGMSPGDALQGIAGCLPALHEALAPTATPDAPRDHERRAFAERGVADEVNPAAFTLEQIVEGTCKSDRERQDETSVARRGCRHLCDPLFQGAGRCIMGGIRSAIEHDPLTRRLSDDGGGKNEHPVFAPAGALYETDALFTPEPAERRLEKLETLRIVRQI